MSEGNTFIYGGNASDPCAPWLNETPITDDELNALKTEIATTGIFSKHPIVALIARIDCLKRQCKSTLADNVEIERQLLRLMEKLKTRGLSHD